MAPRTDLRHGDILYGPQLKLMVGWLAVLTGATLALAGLTRSGDVGNIDWTNGYDGWADLADAVQHADVDMASQVVPTVVVAVFVFAVGVAFVVAQVVPPARGTRAVGALRGTRLSRSISPAPALIAGSVALIMDVPLATELVWVLLFGSVLYTAVSVVLMLSILIDATDPEQFKGKLVADARRSLEVLDDAAAWLPVSAGAEIDHFPAPVAPDAQSVVQAAVQQATDDLYAVVRTLRGWARVASRSNDSRELYESLEGLLEVVGMYQQHALSHASQLTAVPESYWVHANPAEAQLRPTTPSTPTSGPQVTHDGQHRIHRNPWGRPPLVLRGEASDEEATCLHGLPVTWFPDEVGRAVVRAVELGLQGEALLDRDTVRLLSTLVNGSLLLAGIPTKPCERHERCRQAPPAVKSSAQEWSAAVMIRYLTEVGLGARHAPRPDITWYIEPCARLVYLRAIYASYGRSTLSDVATAGLVLVLEALVSREQKAAGSRPIHELATVASIVELLRRAREVVVRGDAADRAVALAMAGDLEPRERSATYVPSAPRLRAIALALG